MARARNIKPSFFTDGELTELEPLARILFAGLWCLADKYGRLKDKPRDIKLQILPADDCDIDNLLHSLTAHFITRYEVDGQRYIQINNFSKHQNPHKNEIASDIPAPLEITGTIEKLHEQHPSNRADSFNLIPDSLNSDSLKESGAAAPPPPEKPAKPEKHKHGQYGWVRLTDTEYQRLIHDHGEETTKHYIAVVDELAQQTGNKNKWRDWNLTVRKAIRNQWGAPYQAHNSRGQPQNDFLSQLYTAATEEV